MGTMGCIRRTLHQEAVRDVDCGRGEVFAIWVAAAKESVGFGADPGVELGL